MASPKIDTPFIAIPEWLLRWQPSPEMGLRLSLTDKAVWAAFRDRIANKGSVLSYGYMAEYLGVSVKVLRCSIEKLERAGLLLVRRASDPLAGKRDERANRYAALKPDGIDKTAASGADSATFESAKRAPQGTVNVPFSASQRAPEGTVNVPLRAPNTEHILLRQQKAVADGANEVEALLLAQGADRKVAAAEAARPGVTVELVRAAVAWADEQKGLRNRAGFILTAIRDKSPELLEHVKFERRRAEDERRRKGDAERLERDRRAVAAIPDDQWESVAAAAGQRIRQRWPHARPEREIERVGRSVDRLQPLYVEMIAQAWALRGTPICSERGVA